MPGTEISILLCLGYAMSGPETGSYTPKSITRNRIPGASCTELLFLVLDFGVYRRAAHYLVPAAARTEHEHSPG
eukprot:498864-Rhodomonas_salina.2